MRTKICLWLVAMGLAAGVALADKGWSKIGSVKGGETITLKVNQSISRVAVKCTEGAIEVESIIVATADRKIPFKMNAKLAKGETQPVSVGNAIDCRELVVEISGQGAVDVSVRP
jgi:hypothetical protein